VEDSFSQKNYFLQL